MCHITSQSNKMLRYINIVKMANVERAWRKHAELANITNTSSLLLFSSTKASLWKHTKRLGTVTLSYFLYMGQTFLNTVLSNVEFCQTYLFGLLCRGSQ